jgi:hypothetical protein
MVNALELMGVEDESLETWAQEAQRTLDLVGDGPPLADDRRRWPRAPYRTLARLQLFGREQEPAAHRLLSHDLSTQGMGFITDRPLPLERGGCLMFRAPRGRAVAVRCYVLRCRPLDDRWFEGAVLFCREERELSPEPA